MTAADHPVSPEDLMAYLDRELPVAQAAVVHAHVAGCDECQRSSGELRGVSRDMARWPIEEAPPTLRAPWPLPENDRPARSRFGWFLRPSTAFAAAVSVLAVLGAVGTGLLSNTKSRMLAVGVGDAPQDSPASEALAPYAGPMPSRYSTTLDSDAVSLKLAPALSSARVASARAGVTEGQTLGPSIARTATLRLRSRDFEASRRAVERIAGDMGGWFSHFDVSSVERGRTLNAAVQFPAARLDAALAALKPLGLVLEESQKGEDVAEQIVDMDARLSNARNTEKRLVDLLQKRTGELEQVLAAEREISRVREEIERFDAQRKNLGRRVTYATLTLEVIEEKPATISLGPRPVSGRFRDALVTGLTDAADAALEVALLIVRVAPSILLCLAVLGWPVVLLVRWSQRRTNSEP